MMIDLGEFFINFSMLSFALLFFLRMLRKNISNINMSPLMMTSLSPIHQREEEEDEDVDRDFVAHPIKVKEESNMVRNRPPPLVIPGSLAAGSAVENKSGDEMIEVVEGRGYSVVSKKGRRKVMEDAHSVMVDLFGNHKQGLFVVIDGHGGRGTADFVKKNLGKNIVKELKDVRMTGHAIERAYRRGHLLTDEQIIFQGISGGACAASVLVMGGQLHIANVGDCRVVLSRNGKAVSLTKDHRPNRYDERSRIDKSGGYVTCRNGVWRVNGTLAVSRAFGDRHMKKFIISDPEITRLPLTSDCEFLIMASDGLWDKVDEQEAVELVSSEKDSLESCKKLVDISFSRGNDDDITVMIINLKSFVT